MNVVLVVVAIVLIAAIGAAVLGVLSPLVSAAVAVGLILGVLARTTAAWRASERDPQGTRLPWRKLGAVVTFLVLIGVFLAVVFSSNFYAILDETVAYVPYAGTADLDPGDEAWDVTHVMSVSDEVVADLAAAGIDIDALAAAAEDEGWSLRGLAGGGVELSRTDVIAGPEYEGLRVSATVSLAVPDFEMLVDEIPSPPPTGFPLTSSIRLIPAPESTLSIRAPRGALHGTRPATDSSSIEAGGTESRVVTLGNPLPDVVVVDVVRPAARGTPAAQLVGMTPTIFVGSALGSLVSVATALQAKAVDAVVAWIIGLFGRKPKQAARRRRRPRGR